MASTSVSRRPPARLDLNKTFQNDSEKWVNFPRMRNIQVKIRFFPLDEVTSFRLKLLDQVPTPKEAREAFVRFLVSVAYLIPTKMDGGKLHHARTH